MWVCANVTTNISLTTYKIYRYQYVIGMQNENHFDHNHDNYQSQNVMMVIYMRIRWGYVN